ncbi:MAG: hypothetical protein J6L81_07685 [Clostridia bacterium]|nr:hypothetical protein [Clostridia bacterium]
MFQTDYIMRQIETFVRVLAKVLLGKDQDDIYSFISVDETGADTDPLQIQLEKLISLGNINEAEDLLFEKLEEGDMKTVETALRFYKTLNDMSDEQLEECNFSREEITEGIKEIGENFGISL